MTPWEIEASEFVNCNCAYGCPCQFNAPPTHGDCHVITGVVIKKGYFGDVRLDGLNFIGVLSWPGAIHEGGGKAYVIVDERATDAQRQALLTILSGQETEPGKTVWNVFAATIEEMFEPEFRSIEIEIDVEARIARIHVDDLIESVGRPILNPITGEEHRVRIDLPDGFEYTLAEMGSGSSRVGGLIPLDLNDSYGQFAHIHLSQSGIVR
ncbi:MAG TPA: DUF1326 domain-containing protein [Hyphomicrobiaceae bacterium]|nr:DUF1326 domain-containing protein [Hyphomicrobiaceae bacterium]